MEKGSMKGVRGRGVTFIFNFFFKRIYEKGKERERICG